MFSKEAQKYCYSNLLTNSILEFTMAINIHLHQDTSFKFYGFMTAYLIGAYFVTLGLVRMAKVKGWTKFGPTLRSPFERNKEKQNDNCS